MKLPTISYPTYDVSLLSQTEPVKIRPFLVKEQKLMMMATEAKEVETTISTVKQIINNCTLTELDVNKLPLVDLETLFLHLRARSMGETASVYFQCKNEPEPNTSCGMIIEVHMNLLNIPIVNKDKQKKIIFSDNNIGVIMKYPSFDVVSMLSKNTENSDVEYLIVANSIDKIFNEDDVYNASDATQDELLEFLMNLPQDKYDLMKDFTENSPHSRLTTKQRCSKCSYDHEFVLEGLSDFFI